jgi:hypothetical protein
VGCQEATAARHFQLSWFLARGHTVAQVSATPAFGARWIEQSLARYNAAGPEARGDLRPAMLRKPELLAKRRDRLRAPPDGGPWSSRKGGRWPRNSASPRLCRSGAGARKAASSEKAKRAAPADCPERRRRGKRRRRSAGRSRNRGQTTRNRPASARHSIERRGNVSGVTMRGRGALPRRPPCRPCLCSRSRATAAKRV